MKIIKTKLTIFLLIALPSLSLSQTMNIQETVSYVNNILQDFEVLCSSITKNSTYGKRCRKLRQNGQNTMFLGGSFATSDDMFYELNLKEVQVTANSSDKVFLHCNDDACLKVLNYTSFKLKSSATLYSSASPKIIIRLSNALTHLKTLIEEKYPDAYVDPFEFHPSQFSKPLYSISGFAYKDQNLNEKIDPNEAILISFNLKNSGSGSGKKVKIEIEEINNVPGLSFKKDYIINSIQPSQVIKIKLQIQSDNLIEINEAYFIIRVTENNNLIEELSLIIPTYTTGQTKLIINRLAEVDLNIPVSQNNSNHKYALVIGNEDYKTYQPGLTNEVNVKYAENDAVIFNQYLIKTLGVPKENITLYLNATSAQMRQGLSKMIHLIVSDQNAQIIIYFAGHGLPEINTKEQYLIPVDVSGTDLRDAISINEIIRNFGQYEGRKVIMILDACFSGGARNSQLIAQRGVKIKPKPNLINGDIVVISASSGLQRSHGYPEKSHGIFTYYFLKSLQENNGSISLGELADYLSKQVNIKSVLLHNEEQTPQVRSSSKIKDSWMDWKL